MQHNSEGRSFDTISIVVPCHNEEESLPFLFEEFDKLEASMAPTRLEFVFVDDGSGDSTVKVARSYASEHAGSKVLSLSRNFGKESAIFAGLQHAEGDYVALMDADLQDPPALLPEMYRIIREEDCESVATRRSDRAGEPPVRSLFARLFYRMINAMSETELVDGARDYRLMSRKFVDALLSLGESNRFSKGLFSWVGFKTHWIEYSNVERSAGSSQWSFMALARYAVRGITAFSAAPLVFASLVGFVLCMVAVIALLFIIVRWALFGDPVSGWPSLACMIIFIGGVQLLFLGVLGQYLANTYNESKRRP
ncbi:MAG: glycosyltransferase family 2 protein, partial [Olsenella sp.]|nr:glycosyltransferase family 2 protein [Olsenella sp.]